MLPNRFRHFSAISGPLDPSFGPAAALFGHFWPAGPVFWARRGTFRPFLARWTRLLGPPRYFATISGPLDPSFGPAAVHCDRFWPARPVFLARRGTWRLRARLLVFSRCTSRGPKCRQLSGLERLRGLPFQLFTVIDLFGFVDGLPEGDGTAVRLYFCRQ